MANFKLKKNANGKVNVLLRSGKDFVSNEMAVAAAQHIIDDGLIEESGKEGYPIKVGEWYFEGEPINNLSTGVKEIVTPEPVGDVKEITPEPVEEARPLFGKHKGGKK